MPRRMACSMTIGAVRDRTKTVTRRHVGSWAKLAVGDRLTLIEKGMGLAKGEKQVVLAEVEIVDVAIQPLGLIRFEMDGTAREGLGSMYPNAFMEFWALGHGYGKGLTLATLYEIPCRRIEWRYLDQCERCAGWLPHPADTSTSKAGCPSCNP